MATWYNRSMQHILDIRRQWLRRAVKAHAVLLLVFLGVYFVFAFLDPGLLSYDWRQKFRALADETYTITATVLGPPVQPVVTATAECNVTTGVLRVSLDWAVDVNSFSYDIDRDSSPLVTGLASSLYSDTNVVVATTYLYQVTAHGPMGPGLATSVPVSVTTPTTCEITAPAPAVAIVSFAGRNIDVYGGAPHSSSRRPLFTGTTSMANAMILVTIGMTFIAEFPASSTGYWEWKPPYGVKAGSHTFTVTATDPGDLSRHATATLLFEISDSNESGQDKKRPKSEVSSPASSVSVPLEFTLTADEAVFQGEELHTQITIGTLKEKYNHVTVPIRYSVSDKDGATIFSKTYERLLIEGIVITEIIPVPLYVFSGKYTVTAEILLDNLSVSRHASFMVRELPLIQLSGGGMISYADIVQQLGWIVFLAFLLLFLWLYLFIREYALYLQGDGEVTEYDLNQAGYFRK